jgi:hypothetical protein
MNPTISFFITLLALLIIFISTTNNIVTAANNIQNNKEASSLLLRGNVKQKLGMECDISCFLKRISQCYHCSSNQDCVITSCHPCHHECVDETTTEENENNANDTG